MIEEKIKKRLEELIAQGEQVRRTEQRRELGDGVHFIPVVDVELSQQWTTSALATLRSAFGEANVHFQQVASRSDECWKLSKAMQIQGCLKAALADMASGFVLDVRPLIEAEVLDDFLVQATVLHASGYKDAAAVLAGGVLERHLRLMCLSRSISLTLPSGKAKMIDGMNADLATAGAYDKLKLKQITVWADIRNKAAHGDYALYTSTDVASLLNGVADFCTNVK